MMRIRWVLSAVFAVFFMLLQTIHIYAVELGLPDETYETDTVYNEKQLANWLEQHCTTGGTVFLGNSVTITQPVGIYDNAEIIINTGKYGFVFDGSALPTNKILITGEGVDVPVVDVLRVGEGWFYEASWNNTLLEVNVTATGRNGIGGTALRISAEDTKSFSTDRIYDQGMIRSYGEGAVGLWLDAPTEAWCYRVEVFGDSSTAVYAPNGGDLFFCKLTAEGESAKAASGNDVSLDSCATSPEPSGVKYVNRRAMADSFSRLYLPLKQNTTNMTDINTFNTPAVFLQGEDGSVISIPFVVVWDMGKYNQIHTSVLGETRLTGTVVQALYGLDVFENVPIELTVEVRDPDLPCISRISVREVEDNRFARLLLWKSADPQDENVILWRSDDEGETWRKFNHSPEIIWNGNTIDFYYEKDELEHPVWFQLEVIGEGESNIAVLNEKDGVFIGGNGGDRTGTDRGGVNPPDGEDSGDNNNDDEPSDSGNSSGGEEEADYDDNDSPSETTEEDLSEAGEKQVDAIDSDIPTSGGTDLHTITISPADTPALTIQPEDVPVLQPVTEAPVVQTAPQEKPVAVTEALPADKEPAQIFPAENSEKVLVTEPEAALTAAGQSAPESEFSASGLTFFFLGVAGVGSGALLFLRLSGNGRWQRGKR